MQQLKGRVAVVTGASRGAGRGISLALGEAGATVYVSARSHRAGSSASNLPGTIEETAEGVTARGGRGIPVCCDHTVDVEVESLFERVRVEQGRLDILVNNVWGGYEQMDQKDFAARFWDHPFAERWNKMFNAGLRAHFHASSLAAPLMVSRRQGLMISTVAWDHDKYIGSFYDVAKQAIVRMVFVMAIELRTHNVAAIAVAPGWMRTERMMASPPADLSSTESPEYVGRAVVALACDPRVMEKSGRAFRAGELALEYGFTDIDGRQVPAFTFPDFRALVEGTRDPDDGVA